MIRQPRSRTVTHLLVDDLAVDFSSGDVIIATQSDVEVAFVVAEVEFSKFDQVYQ